MQPPASVPFMSLRDRQRLLIDSNVRPLRQLHSVLEQIDDCAYSEPAPGFEPQRAGGHVRHILDFYECFFDGISSSHVDYEARKRDESVEKSRKSAISKVRSVIRQLEESIELRGDSILWIRVEGRGDFGGDCYLTSSVARELQALASHTVHHSALIGMALAAHGVAVDPDFGMAPSTLRYRDAGRRRAEHAVEAA